MGLDPYQVAPSDPRLAQAHRLIHASFASMEGRVNPPSSVRLLTPDLLAQQATKGEVWAIGDPVAACVVLSLRPNALYLGKLSTASNARRQGHARRLIDHAATRAHMLKLPHLELESRIELSENHLFFKSVGFVEISRTAHEGFDEPTSITYRREVEQQP